MIARKERIYVLRNVSIHHKNLDEKEMRYIRQSQNELLKYASEGKLSEPDIVELKGFIHAKSKTFILLFSILKKQ